MACSTVPALCPHLGDACSGHVGLIEEHAAKHVTISKPFVLRGEVAAARVHKVHARQAVLNRDLLRTQFLLDGGGEVRATLHCGIVGDDHTLDPAV